jgi:hypothetical protein
MNDSFVSTKAAQKKQAMVQLRRSRHFNLSQGKQKNTFAAYDTFVVGEGCDRLARMQHRNLQGLPQLRGFSNQHSARKRLPVGLRSATPNSKDK